MSLCEALFCAALALLLVAAAVFWWHGCEAFECLLWLFSPVAAIPVFMLGILALLRAPYGKTIVRRQLLTIVSASGVIAALVAYLMLHI